MIIYDETTVNECTPIQSDNINYITQGMVEKGYAVFYYIYFSLIHSANVKWQYDDLKTCDEAFQKVLNTCGALSINKIKL